MSVTAPTRAAAAPPRRWGRILVGALATLALLAGALLAGPPGEDADALDPRSTAPDGLRGLVELGEATGATVDIATDIPSDTSIRLLLVEDRLGGAAQEELRAWIRRGGQLVVSDAASPLHGLEAVGQSISDLVGPSTRSPDCPLAALDQVDAISHAGWIGFETTSPEEVGCFAAGDESPWLVARAHGEGTLVALGSPAPLVNRSLDRDDNAVLAAALLFPDGDSQLQVMPPASVVGEGEPSGREEARDVSVEDLLPDGFARAATLALLAVLLALLAVGRRLGHPVGERLPPTVPSAELARSVGDLLQRAGSREGAATRLRDDARLGVRTALGADLDPEALAHQAHERLGVDLGLARTALVELEVTSDDDLVEVATAVSTVHDHLVSAT